MSRSSFFPRTPTALGSPERGDTLVEVLVAVVIIGMAVTALLGTLLTTTTASIDHRAITSFDTYLASFSETARNQIEFQPSNGPSSGPTYTPCAANYDLVGAPIPHAGPVGAQVAVLGTGFVPTSATITGTSGSSPIAVSNFTVTNMSTAQGFIVYFNVPSAPSGSYTVSLTDGAHVYNAASSFVVSGISPAPAPTFNENDSFTVTTSYWNSGWTTDRANCSGNGFNPNIQQLKFALADAQPNNGAGSVQTIVVTNLSPQEVPAPPAVLTAAPVRGNPNTINLSWFPPTYQGADPVTGYNLYRSTTPGIQGMRVQTGLPCSSNPCQYTDSTGVVGGTNYYYEITAVSSAGESYPSTQAGATTVPGRPAGLIASPGNNQVKLTWSAPSGNAQILEYLIYRSTTNTQPPSSMYTSSCASSCAFPDMGLTNGTTYYYWVTAVNAGGEGQAASASATPATVPTPPTGLVVSQTNSSGNLQLTWLLPSSNGGSPISTYNIYRSPTNARPGAPLTLPPGAISCTLACQYTDSGRFSGTTYYYWVTAVNGAGESPAAGPSSGQAGAPGAPTSLAASTGSGLVTLNWTAPSATGGSSISGYKIYRSPTPGTQGVEIGSMVPASTTSYQDNPGTSGTPYYYEVTAVNVASIESVPSNQVPATP